MNSVCDVSLFLSISLCRLLCYIFFFFQAEDGIRDLTVTGVQTCALPILRCLSCYGEHGFVTPQTDSNPDPELLNPSISAIILACPEHVVSRGKELTLSVDRKSVV